MSLTLRTNVASLDAQRNLSSNEMSLNSSLSRLSSGYRINSAGDDAAGLGISVNLDSLVRSYNQASRNANDGISLVQTAEGNLNEVTNILTRMRELAMESASDGLGSTERGYINTEATSLQSELDRVNATAEYNGTTLFGGAAKVFQVGVRSSATNDVIKVDLSAVKVDSASLKVDSTSIALGTDAATSQSALSAIDAALVSVSTARSSLGAVGNQFNMAITNIATTAQNLSAAKSRIKDVDVAQETSMMTASQVLVQAGVSVLAQANQLPQLALKLLQ